MWPFMLILWTPAVSWNSIVFITSESWEQTSFYCSFLFPIIEITGPLSGTGWEMVLAVPWQMLIQPNPEYWIVSTSTSFELGSALGMEWSQHVQSWNELFLVGQGNFLVLWYKWPEIGGGYFQLVKTEHIEMPAQTPIFSSCCVAEDQVKTAESFSPWFLWVKQTPSPSASAT